MSTTSASSTCRPSPSATSPAAAPLYRRATSQRVGKLRRYEATGVRAARPGPLRGSGCLPRLWAASTPSASTRRAPTESYARAPAPMPHSGTLWLPCARPRSSTSDPTRWPGPTCPASRHAAGPLPPSGIGRSSCSWPTRPRTNGAALDWIVAL
eukprot:7661186-Alexandrium_andersonii.AAC.1